jgi:hypothetical protein
MTCGMKWTKLLTAGTKKKQNQIKKQGETPFFRAKIDENTDAIESTTVSQEKQYVLSGIVLSHLQ